MSKVTARGRCDGGLLLAADRSCRHVGVSLRKSLFSAAVVPLLLTLLPSIANSAPRQAALIVDANTGAVISAHSADEPRYPASLTKMMTLYVLFDLIEQGRLNYQSRIKVSETAANQPPSKLGIEPGSEITVIDAIKALVTKSANDIAVAVAERIAGSEQKFAALMTQKARAIGMSRTTFRNASGLPDDEQVTTARDMVTLALRLQDDFPKHYPLFATREFRYGSHSYTNHNTLLGQYDGTDGIKTGYTRASGFNLVSSVKRGQKHVVGAVFGGTSAASRNQTMRTLLNIGLLRGSNTKTRVAPRTLVASKAKAEPRLAEAPRPAPRPTPVRMAAAASPAAPAAQPEPAAIAAPAPAPASGWKNIEIARVRPILVAPNPRRAAPAAVAAAVPSPSASPAVGMQQPVSFTMPPLAATAAPAPAPTRPIASASPPPLRLAAAPPAAEVTPSATAAQSIQRGLPPSTLGAQAAALDGRSQPVPPSPSQGRMGAGVTQVASSSGAAAIQIGAYTNATDAERQIASIRQRAGDLVGRAPGAAIAAEASGRTVYRARFTGYDVESASSVCNELRRRRIDCLVAR